MSEVDDFYLEVRSLCRSLLSRTRCTRREEGDAYAEAYPLSHSRRFLPCLDIDVRRRPRRAARRGGGPGDRRGLEPLVVPAGRGGRLQRLSGADLLAREGGRSAVPRRRDHRDLVREP